MEIIPLGDSALILRVGGQFEDAAEETLNEVLEVSGRLEEAHVQIEKALAEARKFDFRPMAKELEQMLVELRTRAPAPLGASEPGG